MPTAINSPGDVTFNSAALPNASEFHVKEVDGREGISRLFEFTVLIESTMAHAFEDDEIQELLSTSCVMGFAAEEKYPVYGMVRAIESSSVDEDHGRVSYRLTVVPRLWNATQTVRSGVYQSMNVVDVVKSVLKESGLADAKDADWAGVVQKHPKREYIVQYQETDYNFISRLLEHEGIHFHFAHRDGRDVVVFGDTNATFKPHVDHASGWIYDGRGSTEGRGETVKTLHKREHTVPSGVELREYNYRTASAKLQASATADKKFGVGDITEYGDHFTDVNDGSRMAKMRAHELLCRKLRHELVTRIRGVHPGMNFKLENHPHSEQYHYQYIVAEVRHRIRQSGAGNASVLGTRGVGYENTVVAYLDYTADKIKVPDVMKSVQWRPARVAPRPRLYGLMHAKIDGEVNGMAAPIDEFGRYKVLWSWDTRQKEPGGRSTQWIRRVQMATGPDFGMHFPIHVGTEVMVAHLDGDPDRPVIVGSVPNSDMPSPVTRDNATQAIFRTKHEIALTFEDDQ